MDRKKLLFILGIIFVAFNLRPSITVIGPVISDIRIDTGMSNGMAGLLTTLPLLAFAIISPLAPIIAQRFGIERTIMAGLFLIGFGILIRPTDFIGLLFVGTVLVGLGVALGNVLLPGIVKQKFTHRVGLATGIYTLSMTFMASMGSGLSVPLAHGVGLGWKNTLIVWGTLTILAIIIWIPQVIKKNQTEEMETPNPKQSNIWKSKIAWSVTIFMGLQSFLFYCTISWLPEILISRGIDMSTAGWMVSIMQIVGLPSTIIAPSLADRFSDQRVIMAVIGVIYTLGLSLLLISNQFPILIVSTLFIGISQGATIALSLAFLSLRTRDSKQAANLSGMAQSVGYLLAAVGPFALGLIYDGLHTWSVPIVIMIIVCVIMVGSGVGASRPVQVSD